jgi:cytochrome c556
LSRSNANRHNVGVEDAFAIVLFVVVGLAVVGAVISLAMSGDTYSHIGRGGMSLGEDRPLRAPGGGSGAPAVAISAEEREADIRSMLEARAARRVARGEPPGDVEAELAALLRPSAGGAGAGAGADPEVEAEVRQLVESRNARLVARGEEPLDVEAEVQRRLREYGAL